MFKFTALALISSAALASPQMDVIYGRDNRSDLYGSSNSLHKRLAKSTAAMISLRKFTRGETSQLFNLTNFTTLERSQNLCSGEAFSQQPAIASCSGFLVAPNILVTAGHCYLTNSTAEASCKSNAWVFDYAIPSAIHDPTKGLSIQNIYLCKKVIKAQLDRSNDFAIIELDRPVSGRTPLQFRDSGKISDSTQLVVIGHPDGMPTKIATGGRVTKNSESTTFSASVDTFHGNSGSAVFDSATGQVEGILIQGRNDYVFSKPDDKNSCRVVNRCNDEAKECLGGEERGSVASGEVAYRIERIASLIKSASRKK